MAKAGLFKFNRVGKGLNWLEIVRVLAFRATQLLCDQSEQANAVP